MCAVAERLVGRAAAPAKRHDGFAFKAAPLPVSEILEVPDEIGAVEFALDRRSFTHVVTPCAIRLSVSQSSDARMFSRSRLVKDVSKVLFEFGVGNEVGNHDIFRLRTLPVETQIKKLPSSGGTFRKHQPAKYI
jgi:hypothetical protein